MMNDYRKDAAAYYDKFCDAPKGDTAFYRGLLPSPAARVLELGCGTGRVLLPLVDHCDYIHGLDLSPGMLAITQRKLAEAGIPIDCAVAEQADITDFDLTASQPLFDLITTPFRVMQNLETDAQIEGLMRCIKHHLTADGTAVLNTFRPRGGAEALKAFWSSRTGDEPAWEKPDGNTTVRLYDNCLRFANDASRVYPTLTYRRYDREGALIDEAPMDIVMRVWQPEQLIGLVESHGFTITGFWGGYEGQAWGEGPELVVAFTHA